MSRPGRFGRRWRESRIEALQQELRELHLERCAHWERHPFIHFEVNRFTEWLKIHPAVVLHLGRTGDEFLAEPGWEPYICPADLARTDALWLRCSLAGIPYAGLEYRWRHAESGRYVFLSETLFPIHNGPDGKPWLMAGWFTNISGRKRAEIDFLLYCLDASGRRHSQEARGEIVRRAGRELSGEPGALPLLRPRARMRGRRGR